MSNFLLQNAGISAFFEDDDDFFGEDTAMCSEVDDEDLPLTNYLLKFDVGEEEPWDSTEDLSVGGESVDERDIFGLGCEVVDDDGVSFTFESGHWNEDAPDRAELVEKELCRAKNKGNYGKEESVKSSVIVDLNNQKQTTTLDPKNVVEAACVVHSKLKATNVSFAEDTFEPGSPNPEDLETDVLDHVGEVFGLENEVSPDKVEVEMSQAKKKGNGLSIQKKKKTSDPKNGIKAAYTVHSNEKVTNVSLERSKNGPLKTTIKTQAEKAKEQRQRKKKFVQELQDTIEELKQEKAGLQQVNTQLNDKIGSLQEEINYLKGVIANQSELAKILRTVANIPGISINCSVLKNDQGEMGKNNKQKCVPAGKKGVNLSDENTKKRRMDIEVNGELENNAGVCVHVQSGKVSLEFCPECSKKAKSTPLS
ncbi:unnamed protein product [Porites evermanni]|uniref:BZIP domain-containing protein n=1 Tax=Porites evermanni TaxID=104178 RepID=A0ABN8QTW6_9CNID|nr:unnamed protein product [Porites evermanni]